MRQILLVLILIILCLVKLLIYSDEVTFRRFQDKNAISNLGIIIIPAKFLGAVMNADNHGKVITSNNGDKAILLDRSSLTANYFLDTFFQWHLFPKNYSDLLATSKRLNNKRFSQVKRAKLTSFVPSDETIEDKVSGIKPKDLAMMLQKPCGVRDKPNCGFFFKTYNSWFGLHKSVPALNPDDEHFLMAALGFFCMLEFELWINQRYFEFTGPVSRHCKPIYDNANGRCYYLQICTNKQITNDLPSPEMCIGILKSLVNLKQSHWVVKAGAIALIAAHRSATSDNTPNCYEDLRWIKIDAELKQIMQVEKNDNVLLHYNSYLTADE